MRVKRYIVDSMPDALQQIRTDLGKDAVILNTKEIRSGGFLGLFSKKKIEVIAATDTASGPANAGRARPAAAAQPQQPARSSGLSPVEAAVAVLEERMAEQATAAAAPRSEETAAVPAQFPVVPRQHGAAAYGSNPGNRTATAAPAPMLPSQTAPAAPQPVQPPFAQEFLAQALAASAAPAVAMAAAPPTASVHPAPPATPTHPTDARPTEQEDALMSELRAMKQMMQKLASSSQLQAKEPHPVIAGLRSRLTDQELRADLIDELLANLEELAEQTGEALSQDFANQFIRDQIRVILGANTHKALSTETKIAHFVGPTGVGKTTTIAKLAAEQVLRYRRKVGFITSDTYRIAAVDQLKTYANILGVPLEVVFSPQDLRKAFDTLSDRDIIFMDTAGRNFRNELYVSELNALLQTTGKSETYLVMSLTTKYKDMRAIAENFSRFKLDKVLFTKRDETDTFGPIVNLLYEFPLQLSYVTTGQNVPDDFTIADENDIIDLILEEQSDA